MPGYIKVYRDICEHWIWKDRPFSRGQAWIDLILLANHDDAKFLLGNQIVEAKRGQIITSEIKLMERWGWSKAKLRYYFFSLESDSMIVKKVDRKKTVITILNYDVWQDSHTDNKPQKDCGKTTDRPQIDTINNDKNVKNENITHNVGTPPETTDEVKEIIQFFNKHRNRMPEARTVSDQRKGYIHARIDKYGIDKVKEVILKAETSEFLNGGGDKAWIADLDWIMKPNNFPKVLEGKFNNKDKPPDRPSGKSSNPFLDKVRELEDEQDRDS